MKIFNVLLISVVSAIVAIVFALSLEKIQATSFLAVVLASITGVYLDMVCRMGGQKKCALRSYSAS